MKPRAPHIMAGAPTARTVALQVLLDTRRHDGFIQEILDRRLGESCLPAADRRLATQLAYGALRRRSTLDALLRAVVKRRPDQVEPWLWEALRLGACQLALLSHIPPHAALFETVELATVVGLPRAKGFLNGILRSVAGLLTPDAAAQPAADALPLEQGAYRRLSRPVLPDPESHPVEYLSAGFAWPGWLAGRWLDRWGWQECLRLGFWFAGPAPLWLRCNLLRTDRDRLLAALAEAGIRAEPGEFPQAVRLLEPASVRDLPGYQQGWFSVQDESAMRVAAALGPQPGMTVLDLCAAPGGKTAHLAELMHNEGRIVACDVDDGRLRTVTELGARLGITIVETCRLHPERNDEPPTGPFDAALVDVPCSNTGVLGKRPEARWRLRPDDFRHLVPLQTKLLIQAAERVKPGGAVVYSTCSIEPEENGQVVRNVLQGLPALALEEEQAQNPGQPADGGYWARLRRRGGPSSRRNGHDLLA
jgi:16S rRNA (cytosine967-C5)-methyltransferase